MDQSGFLRKACFALPPWRQSSGFASVFLAFMLLHSLGLDSGERISFFLDFCTPSVLAGGSVFLAFLAFTLPGFWLEGVYFLVFHLLHSLGFSLMECISCLYAFALLWFLLDGVYFLVFCLLHSLGFCLMECISWFFAFYTPSLWMLGSVFLDFWTFALSWF